MVHENFHNCAYRKVKNDTLCTGGEKEGYRRHSDAGNGPRRIFYSGLRGTRRGDRRDSEQEERSPCFMDMTFIESCGEGVRSTGEEVGGR
jgi:hypothetical protein